MATDQAPQDRSEEPSLIQRCLCWFGLHRYPSVGSPEIEMAALFRVYRCACGAERWDFVDNMFGHPEGDPRNWFVCSTQLSGIGDTEQAGGHDPVEPTKATDVPLTTPNRSSL